MLNETLKYINLVCKHAFQEKDCLEITKYFMNPLRTVIIDDERYACERLKKLLLPFSQIEVLRCLTDSGEAINYVLKNKPDLLFLDVELDNNVSGFDIIDRLQEELYSPFIILVTAHTQYAIKAVKHQVFDYLVKPVDIDELEDTVDRFLKRMYSTPFKMRQSFKMLSDREMSVLKLIFEGKTSQEIAAELFISLNTVHTHRRNILKKTGARSIIDLIKLNNNCND